MSAAELSGLESAEVVRFGLDKPEVKACRSHNSDGEACVRRRGHKEGEFSKESHRGASGAEWKGGIRTPAFVPAVDDGHMSEADYQTWGRL